MGYWFIEREEFDDEIRMNNFLEYGEHNGNLYGTHLDSIRQIIKDGELKKFYLKFNEILEIFFRKNVCGRLLAISFETPSQQSRVHAICSFCRSTRNGSVEDALR